jgi:hypothetical protein
MIGVAILSYDLLPEYRLHLIRRLMSRAYMALLETAQWRSYDASVKREGADAVYEKDPGGFMETVPFRLSIPLTSHLLNRILKLMRYKQSVPVYSADDLDLDALFSAQRRVETEIEYFEKRILRRYRPPIPFAIWLIVFGFFFQLIGAWPH